jgi:CheY-like chemotaxis protein
MPNRAISVLVVEDEALLLFSIADDLRAEGYTVFEASHADGAMRLLEKHPEIRLLFTDIDMPGSMNGLALSETVRRRWPPVKIIITSGKERPAPGDLPEGGVFVSKPYSPRGLSEQIRQMVE